MTKLEQLTKLFKDTLIEDYEIDPEQYSTADELMENLEEQITEDEIIYYSNAIKYLAENDASLTESLGLASELCYEVKNLNSEVLATLLSQQNSREELDGLRTEIEDIFDNEGEE